MEPATFNINMHSPLMLSTSSSINPSPTALLAVSSLSSLSGRCMITSLPWLGTTFVWNTNQTTIFFSRSGSVRRNGLHLIKRMDELLWCPRHDRKGRWGRQWMVPPILCQQGWRVPHMLFLYKRIPSKNQQTWPGLGPWLRGIPLVHWWKNQYLCAFPSSMVAVRYWWTERRRGTELGHHVHKSPIVFGRLRTVVAL